MDDTKQNDRPKTQEEIDDETYNAKDYKKNIYSFSTQELEELQPLEDATRLVQTFLALGQIAQKAKDNYVGGQVLDRLGVKKSQDSKFSYDLGKKRIIVYEPRLWCSMCDAKKAEYKVGEQIFCRDCIEIKKKELGKPLEEKEKKSKKKS
ncbi:MAG: hypothetical protein C5B43_04145 [Verrucomicrobia bacterium]|nr:MAG: hypothetical protein C5B43_04145 [Verrucomicrobiota bacterium]